MKKTLTIFGAILLATLILASCGGNNGEMTKEIFDEVKKLSDDKKLDEITSIEEKYRDKKFTLTGVTINGGGANYFLRNISTFSEVDGRFVKKSDSVSLLNFAAFFKEDGSWISTGYYSEKLEYPKIKFNCYFNNSDLLNAKKLKDLPINFHGVLNIGKSLENRLNGLYIIPSMEFQNPQKEINFFGSYPTATNQYFYGLLEELCTNSDEIFADEYSNPDKIAAAQQEIVSFEDYLKKVVDNANKISLKEDKKLLEKANEFAVSHANDLVGQNNAENEQTIELGGAYDPQSDESPLYSNKNEMINRLKEFIFAADNGFVFYVADEDIKALYKLLEKDEYKIISKEGSGFLGPNSKEYMYQFSEFFRQKFTIVGDFKTIEKGDYDYIIGNLTNCKIEAVDYLYPEAEDILKKSKIKTETIKNYLQKKLNADMYNKVIDNNASHIVVYSMSDYNKLMESLVVKYNIAPPQELPQN